MNTTTNPSPAWTRRVLGDDTRKRVLQGWLDPNHSNPLRRRTLGSQAAFWCAVIAVLLLTIVAR